MDITSLDNQTKITLSHLKELEHAAAGDEPALLKVTSPAAAFCREVNMQSMIHPGLDGSFHFSLYELFRDAFSDELNFDLGLEGIEDRNLPSRQVNITLGADVNVNFTLFYQDVYFHSSVADILSVPEAGKILFEFPHYLLTTVHYEIINGMGESRNITAGPVQFTLPEDNKTQGCYWLDLEDIPNGALFQIIAEGNGKQPFSSPLYKKVAGDWQDYFFRNDSGYWEQIPLCGRLGSDAKFKIKNVDVEKGSKKVSMHREDEFVQASGPLSRLAYENLLKLLESDIIYHGNRLINIQEITAKSSPNDDQCSLEFKFKYA